MSEVIEQPEISFEEYSRQRAEGKVVNDEPRNLNPAWNRFDSGSNSFVDGAAATEAAPEQEQQMEQDPFAGGEPTFAEYTEYREKGTIPERFKPAEPKQEPTKQQTEQQTEPATVAAIPPDHPHRERVRQAEKWYPDFQQVIEAGKSIPMSPMLGRAIAELPNSVDVVYALVKNPLGRGIIESVSSMPPQRAKAELTKISNLVAYGTETAPEEKQKRTATARAFDRNYR